MLLFCLFVSPQWKERERGAERERETKREGGRERGKGGRQKKKDLFFSRAFRRRMVLPKP